MIGLFCGKGPETRHPMGLRHPVLNRQILNIPYAIGHMQKGIFDIFQMQ